jgi:ATP-dependent DNA helicase PIF1
MSVFGDFALLARYPLKREVESWNNRRLNALSGKEHIYHSVDSAGYDVYDNLLSKDDADQLLDRMIAVPSITLKVRAYGFL